MNRNRGLHIFFIACCLLYFIPSQVVGQSDLKKAKSLFKNSEYCKALPHFNKHLKNYVDKDALVYRGRAHYHCNQLNEAIRDFDNALILKYNKDEIYLFLAQANHQLHDFERAIHYYKEYLSKNRRDDRLKKRVTSEIKRCATGINLRYESFPHLIENMGDEVNSEANEINLVPSPQHVNRFYYSRSSLDKTPAKYTILSFDSDSNNITLNTPLNKNAAFYNELIAGISPSGQQLYFSRYNEETGINNLLIDQFTPGEEPLSNYSIFEGPIRYDLGDRDLFCIDDSTFLFSSKRLSGYGGYDIYMTGHRKGYWFKAINLGKFINSSYDEISPSFLKASGTLYFSSNSTLSIGGFDVFSAPFSEKEQQWKTISNLGFPVNSAGNDLFFKALPDSKKAFLSSDRKIDAYGAYDLYRIVFEKEIADQNQEVANSFLSTIKLTPEYQKLSSPQLQQTKTSASIQNDTLDEVQLSFDYYDFEDKLVKIAEQSIFSEISDTSIEEESNSMIIKPLYYKKNEDLLSNNDIKSYLESIIELMLERPSISIELIGHSSEGNDPKKDWSYTLELLLPIVQLMVDKGVTADRLNIIGAGSDLPLAKKHVSERLKSVSDLFNNRIEIRIIDPTQVTFEKKPPFVVQHLRDDSWYLYESLIDGLSYSLVAGPFDQISQAVSAAKYSPLLIEMDIFKELYFARNGLFKSFVNAKLAFDELEVNSKSKFRIAPFLDGSPIEEKDLLNVAKEYTDLINYIEIRRK